MGAIRVLSVVFGIAFLAAGIAGYMPMYVSDGNLFGVFEVNSMHNIVHIASGVIALLAATKTRYARLYFQVLGLVYGAVAIAGFVRGGDLFIMHANSADNVLHLVIAIAALYIGFFFRKSERA